MFPGPQECSRVDYLFPQQIDAHTIAFLRSCSTPDFFPHSYELIAYDLRNDAVRTILPEFESTPGSFQILGPFSFDERTMTAVVGVGDSMCGTLAVWDPKGVRYPDLSVSGPGGSWSPGDLIAPGGAEVCSSSGNGGWGTWAPDGGSIIFFVSTDVIGKIGFDRLDQEWSLYSAPPSLDSATLLLSGIVEPRSPAWSPDGRWLAFSGTLEGESGGTWLLDPSDGSLILVSSSKAAWLDWAPEGEALYGIFPGSVGGSELIERFAIPPGLGDGT